MSYSICLIIKNAKISEKESNNEKSVIRNLSYYTQVEHIKIKGRSLYIFNQFKDTPEILALDKFGSMFVNHYAYYSIKDLIKAYETITGAYKTISISKNAKNECNDIVAFNELIELMHSNLQDDVYGAAFNGVEFIKDYGFNNNTESENTSIKTLNQEQIKEVINITPEVDIEIKKEKKKKRKREKKKLINKIENEEKNEENERDLFEI